MSIENQAVFYLRNVCDYDPNIKKEALLTESVIYGFYEFSNLLRTIYQDWRSYEISTISSERTKIGIMTDDLENYHNLTFTLDFLFAIAIVGELKAEGETPFIGVNKSLLKNEYKQSVAFPSLMLEKYGFYFYYFKCGKEINEYKRCDCFHVYYDNGRYLIESIKYIAHQLMEQEMKKEIPAKVAFMLADYDFILTGHINQNPLQESIKRTLGQLSGLWEELVRVMQNECGFIADSLFNPYVFPNRTVTFKEHKKTICKLSISVDRLNIRLPLSFEMAKELILKRNSLPQSINQNIDIFGCVNCGKCEGNSNIVMVEGVPLCNLPYSNFVTEDSRCLHFDVTSIEEVNIICDVIRRLFKN